ncbi:MAG TPA: DNA mismatch repair endonuclease MutL [Thermodesulfovibrionales bacterium]|nr:DNA mismatch repair endonuclease MutL [Thermodesulfovibrionales bacterium]
MPQIQVLPPILRNKIAAGEVIERPASVVKELIENSIDARSTDIRIEVLYGGKRLIKVSDNGMGMDKEDALLCFERYATSKLLNEEDLFHIKTMGFRGEALPSIASVAKVKLVTAPQGRYQGISIEIQGGEVKTVKDSPSIGTTIEVRDLFFNTPARRKFLKAHNTELFHIIDRVTEEALSYYEIGFSLVSDNHETMRIPVASSPRERILQIYGDEFLEGLIEIDTQAADIKMNSFIAKEGNVRNSKAYQFIFINKRPIRDSSITHAVYSAYEGMLPQKKHPVFFLFLTIDPGMVDVNVHPSKREVRFENKETIYYFVQSSIKEALPQVPPHIPYGYTSTFPSVISEALELGYKPCLSFIYLGDAFIAFSDREGLTLIDQHAAHERILYEKFLRGADINSHRLLFPKQMRLSHKEYHIILQNRTSLRDFGIEVDDFGQDTVIVRSLPEVLREADIRGILSDIASCLIEGVAPDKELREAIAAKIACHQSVRGKTILKQEEVSQLLSDLQDCLHPNNCPHGRPTRIFLSLEDLKKMFKRT